MAENMVHKYTKTEVWVVPDGTLSGAPVVQNAGASAIPGVALVSEGGATKSMNFGPYTVSGIPSGGVGLADNRATVATDGAFRFPVTGATAATTSGTIVYAVVSSGAVTSLTLTATNNTPFGKIDRFIGDTAATESSVFIGRFIDSIGAS